MRTTIRRASLSVLGLCMCTACASAGGEAGAGQPGTRPEQNARFVQLINERNGDFAFYLLGDSVGEGPSSGLYRIPPAETGILPSYELSWSPPR